MRIEIDQSGKIEQTNIITVAGYSNGVSDTISISSTEKIRLQKWYHKSGNPKLFVINTFCALIYLLLKQLLHKQQDLFIDKEYPGYEKYIKNQIINFAQKDGISVDIHYIHFTTIGRGSNAHKVAVIAHRQKNADKKITAKEIIELIKKSGNT